MEYSKPDKKAITAWRISRIMGFVIALIVCTAIGMAGGHLWETEKWKQLLHLGLAIFLLYKLAGIFFYPIIEYKQWGYRITEDKAEIRHGIFFITNSIVPLIRIQHITLSQGPVKRSLGLYDVELSLASDNFKIQCLTKSTAEKIAENLKARLYSRLEYQERKMREYQDSGRDGK